MSLDSLNGNYTSGRRAQSGQIGSRLMATQRHVAYGNADLANSTTAGTPVLWRWIKSGLCSMPPVGCGCIPPAHIIIICSICCALQRIDLSPLSPLLLSPLLQKFCSVGFFFLSHYLSYASSSSSILLLFTPHLLPSAPFPHFSALYTPCVEQTSPKQGEHNSAGTKPGPKTL